MKKLLIFLFDTVVFVKTGMVRSAKATAKMSFRTIRHFASSVFKMKFPVFGIVGAKMQIFNTIVGRVFVKMVNNFCWQQKAAQMLFHNKTVFENIAASARMRMVFFKNHYMAIFGMNTTTAFPPIAFWPAMSKTNLFFRFICMRFNNLFGACGLNQCTRFFGVLSSLHPRNLAFMRQNKISAVFFRQFAARIAMLSHVIIITVFFLLSTPVCKASPPTRANNFISSTTIRASEVNQDLDDLYGYVQTGVDRLATDAVDAITEIKASIRSGTDQQIITGTEGSVGTLSMFNSDGDLVDSSVAVATAQVVTITSEVIIGDPLTGASAGTTLCISATNRICRCNSCD